MLQTQFHDRVMACPGKQIVVVDETLALVNASRCDSGRCRLSSDCDDSRTCYRLSPVVVRSLLLRPMRPCRSDRCQVASPALPSKRCCWELGRGRYRSGQKGCWILGELLVRHVSVETTVWQVKRPEHEGFKYMRRILTVKNMV